MLTLVDCLKVSEVLFYLFNVIFWLLSSSECLWILYPQTAQVLRVTFFFTLFDDLFVVLYALVGVKAILLDFDSGAS